jgi:hypothetical protein
MLTPSEVLDKEYLEVRCMLLEIAAALDRYDAAVERSGQSDEGDRRKSQWMAAIDVLDDPQQKERAARLLELFSEPIS